MYAPVEQLKKSDIVWLSKNKCRHSMPYLVHYQCWLDEKPEAPFTEKIAFLDIEAAFRPLDDQRCLVEFGAPMTGETPTSDATISATSARSIRDAS